MRRDKETDAGEISLGRAFLNWKTVVALIVAGLIVYAFSRWFGKEDLVRLRGYLHGINPGLFALGFLVHYVAYLFLGLRYTLLLKNCGVKISLWQGILTCFMGAATNAAVPGQVGDLYRAYLLRRHLNVHVGQGLGANMAERILDFAFVFGLFFIMSWVLFGRGSDALVSRLLELGLYMLGAAVLVLVLLLVHPTRRLVLSIFRGKVREFVGKFIDGITGSMQRNWEWLIATSAGVWAMESLRFYFVSNALGVHMTIPQIIFTVMATTLLASVPVSISGLGLVEGSATALLTIFRIDAALGLAIIIVDRLISFVSVAVFGLAAFIFFKRAS